MKNWIKLTAIGLLAAILATGPSSATKADAADCEKFVSAIVPISLCFDPDQWTRPGVSSETEFALKRKGAEHYMLMLTQETELEPVILRQAILSQAENTAGPENVETLDESSTKIGSQTLDRIVYRANNKGVDLTFANYYAMFSGHGSMKIVFFSRTKDYANYEPLIEQLAASIEVKQ